MREPTLAEGGGCALLGMGVVGAAFGAAALLGADVHLDFFGTPLYDRAGRGAWVAGCVLAASIGIALLRRRRP